MVVEYPTPNNDPYSVNRIHISKNGTVFIHGYYQDTMLHIYGLDELNGRLYKKTDLYLEGNDGIAGFTTYGDYLYVSDITFDDGTGKIDIFKYI